MGWRRKVPYILIATLMITLVVFQNCSDVTIENVDLPTLLSRDDTGAVYSMCPHTELKPPRNTKFIFAIDMSVSNIGGWIHQEVGDRRYSYWDRTKNTDIDGLRFDAVNSFLNGCGLQEGNEFLAIGFSHSAGAIFGVGKKSLSCTTSFAGSNVAVGMVNQLKQAQLDERPWYEQWENTHLTSNSWPGVLGATSYQAALNCVETVMTKEFSSTDHIGTENYHIFMLSDGKPNDGYQKGCNNLPDEQKEACYISGVDETTAYIMQMGIARQKQMRIHGISYDNQKTGAKEFLDLISRNGNTGSAVELDSFENFSTALCESIISQAAIDFQPDFASAVNLSVVRRDGRLQGDSDIDGLTDEVEEQLGYDPLNPRSSLAEGVLDGICERLGGKSRCKQLRDEIECEAGSYNSLGLSDCDIKILKLSEDGAIFEHALDSDDDGMPDFIEIVKGTDPLRKDMSNDPDSDGLATRSEILLGRDPFAADGDIPARELTEFSVKFEGKVEDEPSCQFGAWKLKMQNVPTVEVKEYTSLVLPKTSHGKDIQVVLVFYRLDAQNTISEKSEFFASYQRVKMHVKTGEITHESGHTQETRHERLEYLDGDRIYSADFVSLGKVNK